MYDLVNWGVAPGKIVVCLENKNPRTRQNPIFDSEVLNAHCLLNLLDCMFCSSLEFYKGDHCGVCGSVRFLFPVIFGEVEISTNVEFYSYASLGEFWKLARDGSHGQIRRK